MDWPAVRVTVMPNFSMPPESVIRYGKVATEGWALPSDVINNSRSHIMKIALVQLDAKDSLWACKEMPGLLALAKSADLIVFPECMPFDTAVPIKEAEAALAQLSSKTCKAAFIAGGYVLDDQIERNAVFLSFGGKIIDRYFKRRPWQEPTIAPGCETVVFNWGGKNCIPLICADAADNPSPTGTKMMYEAIRHGASAEVPIVVSSYGALLSMAYWPDALQTWARGCGAPVVICGISGKGDAFTEDGVLDYFGGGGSGVFWPDDRPPLQGKSRGVYIVDTTDGTLELQPIPSRRCITSVVDV
jgi:predicted amidohydrolase